ncbi:putative mediator of RNA polymerase II transcription subunit 19b, partial [Mucuna pruriens]
MLGTFSVFPDQNLVLVSNLRTITLHHCNPYLCFVLSLRALFGQRPRYGYFVESGNRELGGTRDLINQYNFLPYYEFFCKRSLPKSISETHYLHNVVGDTKIRKGEGMELDELCKNTNTSEKKTCLHPFELDVLSEAFHMREMNPVHFSSTPCADMLYTGQKGLPNAVPKLGKQSRDHERKNKKVKVKGEKYTKQKHRLHRVNNGSCVENIRIRPHDPHPLQLKNQQDKPETRDACFDFHLARLHVEILCSRWGQGKGED